MSLELRGFTLSVSCPSEEYYKARVTITHLANRQEFFKLARELRELLWSISEKYARKKMMGRVQLVKIRSNWTLEFYPIPSRYINQLAYIRRRLYDIVNQYAIAIQRGQLGNKKRVLYLLPEGMAQRFINEVNQLNNEINELNSEVTRYVDSSDMLEIRKLLSRYGARLPVKIYTVPRIAIDLFPIRITNQLIEEWVNRSPEVAKILKQKRRELIEKAVQEIKQRIQKVIQQCKKERNPFRIKNRLEQLKRIAEEAGLQALAESIITPVIQYIENPKINEEPTQEWVDARVKSMLDSLL